MNDRIVLRALRKEDCPVIAEAFDQQGWDKPVTQYQQYLAYQESGGRDVILAEFDGEFAGYLTINWVSDYNPFKEQSIPEVVDFNVLKKYQRRGIGEALMDEAELRISKVSSHAGIGFGVYKDYGPAQILYIKRNYIPDGNGLVRNYKSIAKGEAVTVNDELAFYLTKKL